MAPKNLFDIGPLFEQGPQSPELQGLFGVNPDLMAEDEQAVTRTLQEKMDEVNRETEAEVDKIRNEGMFARYPIVETQADIDRETARLKRRGLDDKEIERRIQKFQRKGGKVKTSAKVMAAATMLGGAIRGYLAVKQGRPLPQQGALQQLQAAAKQRMDDAILKAEKLGDEQKALILAQDEREFKTFLEEIKADAGLRKQVFKESRDLGQPTTDEEGNDLPVDVVAGNVVAEKARRARASEALDERRQRKAEATESRLQAKGAVDTAIDMRDHTMMTDADIAEHFNIPIEDQESINRKRSQIAGRLEIMALQDQAKVIQAGLRRDIDTERLTDLQTAPPPETPEEKHARRMEEKEIENRAEALDEYKSSLPSLLSGVEMFKDDPAILNSMIATQAALLQKSDPDKYPDLKSAVDQMQVDLQQLQEQMGGSGSFVGSMLKRGE